MSTICPSCQSALPADAAQCPACGAAAPTSVSGPGAATEVVSAAALAPVMPRLAQALGSNYEVRGIVGRGGFAEVYEVWDKNLERRLAAKVLSPDAASIAGAMERFTHEARTVAKLSHPAILPIHFVDQQDQLAYYIMPFVEGESLRELIDRRGQLPVAEAIEIVAPVLQALDHAHETGLIHRDIKPDNVMIEAGNGRALLVDFGIAKALDPEKASNLTQAGFAVGTPHFMSPEQVLGDQLDARSDLYSFGAMLFEMVVGRKVFEGTTTQEIVGQHIADPPPPAHELNPAVPTWFSRIVERCLDKQRESRYQRAAELLAALQQGAEGAPPPATGGIIQGSSWEMDEDVYGSDDAGPPTSSTGAIVHGASIAMDDDGPVEVESLAISDAIETATTNEPAPPVGNPDVAGAAPPAPPAAPPPSEPTGAESEEPAVEPVPRAHPPLAPKRRPAAKQVRGVGGLVVGLLAVGVLGAAAWVAFGNGLPKLKALASGDWIPFGGSSFYQVVSNSLSDPVELSVDGVVQDTLNPGSRDSLPFFGEIGWRTLPPQQNGRPVGREFSGTLTTGATVEGGNRQYYTISSRGQGRAIFTPVITNRSATALAVVINPGTPDEERCNCVIRPGASGIRIGYYPLRQDSRIRFYAARRGQLQGRYREVRDIAGQVDAMSGRFPVTVSFP